MTDFEEAARTTADHLRRLDIAFALVGGFAVSIRCEPRFTRDIDLAVAVTGDEQAEAVVRELVAGGYQLLATIEHDVTDRLATVRLARRPGDDMIDLLFASSGIEAEIAAAAELIEVLPALMVPVATVGHLIALKLLASDDRTRPQDAVDLRALAGVANAQDLEVAGRAVRLIGERGYGRGRDLVAALDQLVG